MDAADDMAFAAHQIKPLPDLPQRLRQRADGAGENRGFGVRIGRGPGRVIRRDAVVAGPLPAPLLPL